jgi:hypothetical protein
VPVLSRPTDGSTHRLGKPDRGGRHGSRASWLKRLLQHRLEGASRRKRDSPSSQLGLQGGRLIGLLDVRTCHLFDWVDSLPSLHPHHVGPPNGHILRLGLQWDLLWSMGTGLRHVVILEGFPMGSGSGGGRG